ncbi:RNA polymeras-like protein II mediator complex subunit 10 [Boeremia exigua]|uniref:RNA polymerase-like protein II mediator complex subunit 10 n=1 Tax=Boeremia exigua TaxID=749465 RepID=UPI001E8E27D5|nr:RNA polymerase-like protein II mediator complex subunit 10 [Boeremia exigua]KAH6633176.1 RNA polymeras-like protein II mediator complex subunit 10 [Boeremia exigua]
MSAADTDAIVLVERQLKDIVQTLYNLIVQAYDHHGIKTQEAMKREVQALIQDLVKLSQTAPLVQIDIPPEVTNYVESSRNPDIYTREFVELVQRTNQMLKGRGEAYRFLQEQISWQLSNAVPELQNDVTRVVEATAGKVPP